MPSLQDGNGTCEIHGDVSIKKEILVKAFIMLEMTRTHDIMAVLSREESLSLLKGFKVLIDANELLQKALDDIEKQNVNAWRDGPQDTKIFNMIRDVRKAVSEIK